jgi:hypothetical protein
MLVRLYDLSSRGNREIFEANIVKIVFQVHSETSFFL